jgi:hypothetical protein
MSKSFARLCGAIITTIAASLPAAASTYSIDYSDLWGGGQPNPTENGWGLNLIQQGDVIFATWFVYGQNGAPTWYSATLNASSSSSFSGQLVFVPSGSYFGGAWGGTPPGNVVGNATVTFADANTGTLSYSVNGVSVNKPISRFTLRLPNLAGKYLGGEVSTCSNGTQVLIYDTLTVTQNGQSMSMRVDFFNASGTASQCTYTGTLNPTGRTGSISGTYACTFGTTAGNQGNFTVSNIEASVNGFNANFSGQDQFCSKTGRFGGVKDVL